MINADASGNTVYLDGDVAVTSFKDSSTFFNDGGILLSGDDNGEDNLLYISEVSIYDGFTTPTKNLSATTTLDADADWRADGEVRIPAGGTLDLAGHSLAVSSIKPGALEPVAKWDFNTTMLPIPRARRCWRPHCRAAMQRFRAVQIPPGRDL